MLILDDCDYNLALEHGSELGSSWRCANKTKIAPGHECSNIFNTCHTLLDLTGPLQLGALPGEYLLYLVFVLVKVYLRVFEKYP